MDPLPYVKIDKSSFLEVQLSKWKEEIKFEEIKVSDFLEMLDQGEVIEKGLGYYAENCYGDQAYDIPFGTWSDKKEILHASKEEKGSYSINLARGSFPWCRKELVIGRFRFYKLNK